MYKIITALENPEINEKIKSIKNKKYNIPYPDIQYQEGVLEILEKEEHINCLILSETLEGEYNIYEFINKIKEKNNFLEIIIILENENNKNLKNFLNANGILNIFYDNQITFEDLIKIINNKIENKNELLINDKIKTPKKIILKKNKLKINNKNKINFKIKNKIINIKNKTKNNLNIFFKNKKKELNFNKKIISVVGSGGVGKSSFCCLLSKLIKNKKILIMDFDILNSSVNSIFNTKKYPKKAQKENIKNNDIEIMEIILKVNKNIDILSGTEILINEEYKMKTEIFTKTINGLLTQYDLIIIDTSSECFFNYTKEILKKSNLIIFLVEPNLIELKKSKNLLNIYINKWRIKKEKINIIFNKININSIDDKILNNLFSDFNILGKIKININYNLIINKNIKIINKKIKNNYFKIINKIIK